MDQNVLERILEGSMKPTHLPLETLREITDEFSTDRIIGEGGFGTVYKGIIGNRTVAVKRIRSSMTIDQKLFRREVGSLMEVNHPNVVRFLGLCSHTVETPMKNPESKGYIYVEIRERLLCFEYINNGSLDAKITDELRGLEWDKRYQIIKGICAGLHYIHMEKHILHMDLKPANILLDNQMVPKITDFGLSRHIENSQTVTTHHFASPGYCAPENIFGGRMSVKSDMYSLGVIIIELVTGHKGIPDKNNILRRWRHRWKRSAKETPLEYHQQVTKCVEIGSMCQKIDPYARPSISEIMGRFLEMECSNNHSGNTNERTTVQINPPVYWEDDMLGVEPLELRFGYNNKQKEVLSCSVELSNDTDGFIAFKIQTTGPLPYSIEPNNETVKPRSKCTVDISIPIANAHDHEVAHQYSNKQYNEFIVRSIKLSEDLTTHDNLEEMFDKHTTGHHVDDIHLVVVSEEPSIKEVINLPNEGAKKEHASLGTGTRLMSSPIKPGSVHLVVKKNNNAPLLEYEKKVMLELTAGDYTSDRLGLDLVVVLDVSSSMHDGKMGQLKKAMRFVVQKLSPLDRLSIVTSSYAATKLCSLRQITEASQRELQELVTGLEESDGVSNSNIKNGLLTGLKVLTDRKVNGGRVGGVMLMSNGHMNISDVTQLTMDNVPVYTIGVGAGRNHEVLSLIAAKSMGGTFSHVQDFGDGLTMAFSQCLAGLLSVSVQDLELVVAPVGDESRIVKVTAGSYPQTHDGGSVAVRFGNLYSTEVRTIIVDISLPAVDTECSTEILKVTYSYSSSSSAERLEFVAPSEMLTVQRIGVNISDLQEEKPLKLQREEARLHIVNMIKDATTCHDARNAYAEVVRAQKMLQDHFRPQLTDELRELLELCKDQATYDKNYDALRAYGLCWESSHGQQRFAARRLGMQNMRLFATPLMDMYLEQAKKFHYNPTRPLPSVDDDVMEVRRLSMEKENLMTPLPSVDDDVEEVRRLSLHQSNSVIPLPSHVKGASKKTTNFLKLFQKPPFFR